MVIVAIVGPDGCGKTTQANLLVDRLNKNAYETTYVRPVYIFSGLLRLMGASRNLFSPRRARVSKVSEKSSILRTVIMCSFGYLYALVTNFFMKLTSARKIMVCDRYFYQFFFDLFGESSERVIRIFPKPDITFFLDGDLSLFYSRMLNLFDVSVDRKYYTEVIELYRRISRKYDFIQIDSHLEKKKISDLIFNMVKEKMRPKYVR